MAFKNLCSSESLRRFDEEWDATYGFEEDGAQAVNETSVASDPQPQATSEPAELEEIIPEAESVSPEEDNVEKTLAEGKAIEAGILHIMTANAATRRAETLPTPQDLYKGLWFEGELVCLFADSNIGKTILANQIAEEIAKTRRVLYLDCELSDHQFQMRYSTEDGKTYRFRENLLRATINSFNVSTAKYEDQMLKSIEKAAGLCKAKVIFIDNLTWVCGESEKGEEAAAFMKKLMALKFKYGFSIMVLGHTPKHAAWKPITPNDMAGSKKLFNFFDSVFSMGMCSADKKMRYIKQLKVRTGEFLYDEDKVLQCRLVKGDDGFLKFEFMDTAPEAKMLEGHEFDDTETNSIMEMRAMGKSIREIAYALGVSKSTVGRITKSVPAAEPKDKGQLDNGTAANSQKEEVNNED